MQALVFLLVAVLLYVFADWALRAIERRLGRSLAHRSLVFFGLLLVSAIVSFSLIQEFFAG